MPQQLIMDLNSVACSMLLSLLALCLALPRNCQGVILSATESHSLENYFCGDGRDVLQRKGSELRLSTDVTHDIYPGSFCVVQNLVNVTISSDVLGKQAIIVCNHTAELSLFTTRGFAFLNCSNLTHCFNFITLKTIRSRKKQRD